MEETALEKVVRLAEVTVHNYDRHTKTGQVQHVHTYQRHQLVDPKHLSVRALKGFFQRQAPEASKFDQPPRPPGYEEVMPLEDRQNLARVRKLMKDALRNGMDSTTQYYRYGGYNWKTKTMTPSGWIPERAALHKQILTDILAKADADGVPKDRKAVMSGGPPGSGKTTTLANPLAGVSGTKYVSLSPDDMKEELIKRGASPKVEGLSPMETVTLIHEESFELANRLADLAESQGYNVSWDLSMSSEGQISKRLHALKRNGYTTTGVFISIPLELSVQRAMQRYKKGAEKFKKGIGYGGRFIDPDIIRKSRSYNPKWLTANEKAFDAEKPFFDDWKMFDTSGPGAELIGSKELGMNPARDPHLADLPTGSLRTWSGHTYRKTKNGWEQYSSALAKVKNFLTKGVVA